MRVAFEQAYCRSRSAATEIVREVNPPAIFLAVPSDVIRAIILTDTDTNTRNSCIDEMQSYGRWNQCGDKEVVADCLFLVGCGFGSCIDA